MVIPVERWHNAIFIRRSRRSFLPQDPPREAIVSLATVCEGFRPFREARTVLVLKPAEDIFRGLVGAYGKIRNAPGYAAFIGDVRSPHVQEAVGYTGEGIVLEATALGLGTCWVGGFFDPDAAARDVVLSESERILAVTPVGLSGDRYSFQERAMHGFGLFHRRRRLEDLVEGHPGQDWMNAALEAARVAPSAVNRQPWRFSVGAGTITVSVDSGRNSFRISKRLDCGIAMLHLELGAGIKGVRGDWELLDLPRVARFPAYSA